MLTSIYQGVIIVVLAILIGLVSNIFRQDKLSFQDTRQDSEQKAVSIDSIQAITSIDGPIFLSTRQVVDFYNKKAAIFVDARSPERFEKGHIPQSYNIFIEHIYEYIDMIDQLPKDQWIICYCDDALCEKSDLLANELFLMDFPRVAIYKSGLEGWKKAGMAVE